ncbi:diaminobutyrate--2-oxoglutarate transaminase [Pendulispora brunnea]|uniref:Diaminobutyrate--2-oxoglutarate transaminase n=1 Tax=Pendulispora brunnea TaxID=2905690 RepID=A0ABZ2K5D0_9BACT
MNVPSLQSSSPSHSGHIPNSVYLEQQAARESNARSYPRGLPLALASASGIYVKDADGRSYIDCLAGAGALALGHNHPLVKEALVRAISQDLPMQTLDLTTPVKHRFIDDLIGLLPPRFAERARIQFCGPTGADAIEAALKLVKTATGRRSVLAFRGAYHGMTHGALALTGSRGPKEHVAGLMPDVHFLPYPYAYRCPFGVGGAETGRLASTFVERLLDDPYSGIVSPAALVVEPVQGEGGVIPAPLTWLQEIRRITRERGIPLILDEVQSGLGRTGAMFAFEHADVVPDVLVLSKAIGGGLPMSVVLYDKDLDRWAPGAHAGTFRGNQLAMAAGIATIDAIREQRLDRHAGAMGERLREHLMAIQGRSRCIGDVRGRGLMVGAEIVDREREPDAAGAHPAAPAKARLIQSEALRRGLIVELGGRNDTVVRFLPPLIVTAEQVDSIATIFDEAVRAAEQAS